LSHEKPTAFSNKNTPAQEDFSPSKKTRKLIGAEEPNKKSLPDIKCDTHTFQRIKAETFENFETVDTN